MIKNLAYVIAFVVAVVASFFFTAGILWLISMCFNFTFSWKLALGIWLLMILLRSIFTNGSK